MENHSNPMQLVDESGVFKVAEMDEFVRKNPEFATCGRDYCVVGIMGPQSSGKSTLLNHLFDTNFKEMDGKQGWSQTTKGIWLSKCVGIKPFTMVLDLEGNDGAERGQDTVFEKQAALFALAVSDILLINMRCCDIGRENAANKPLLRTIFEVILRAKGHGRQWRRTTLIFVIRDLEETSIKVLSDTLRKDIKKIWYGVLEPMQSRYTELYSAFKIEVVGLPHYRHCLDEFKKQVALFRKRFSDSIYPEGLACDISSPALACEISRAPALEFSYSSQEHWKSIKENPDLTLPKHLVMVSNVRCEDIANKKLEQLRQNPGWLGLESEVKIAPVTDFGKRLSSILNVCLSEYDEEVQHYDETVRKRKRTEVLERKALDVVYPAYEAMLEHLLSTELVNFKDKMEKSKASTKDELYRSVYYHTKAALSAFDKGSEECQVVIDKKDQPMRTGISTHLVNGISTLTTFVPFVNGSSGRKWDPKNTRLRLENALQLHAIELFSKDFMGAGTTSENAAKEFKEGFLEWLRRIMGLAVESIISIWRDS